MTSPGCEPNLPTESHFWDEWDCWLPIATLLPAYVDGALDGVMETDNAVLVWIERDGLHVLSPLTLHACREVSKAASWWCFAPNPPPGIGQPH